MTVRAGRAGFGLEVGSSNAQSCQVGRPGATTKGPTPPDVTCPEPDDEARAGLGCVVALGCCLLGWAAALWVWVL